MISPQVAEVTSADRPADVEEKTAIGDYYRARAKGAVEHQLPGLRFLIRALVVPASSVPAAGATLDGTAAPTAWSPSGEGAARNFRLRLSFVTETALGADDQAAATAAIGPATGLNTALGDSLSFDVGPVDPVAPPLEPALAPKPTAASVSDPAPVAAPLEWPPAWIWGLFVVALAALLFWRVRRDPAGLDDEDHEAFAARLRRQLALDGEAPDALA